MLGSHWKFLLALGVSLALLLLLLYQVDLREVGDALAQANYVYVIPAIAIYFVAVYFRAVRWRYLLTPLGVFPASRLYPVVIIGYMANNLLPARLGELVRTAPTALPPLAIASAVYLLYVYTNPEDEFSKFHWALLASTALLALLAAYLTRLARPRNGSALVVLGLAGLLLGYSTVGAVRAAYTFDDSNNELLVYAQGSKDVKRTFQDLENQVLRQQPAGEAVKVDYDLWYPFNWYARDAQRGGSLNFNCFKAEDEDGWNESCSPVEVDSAPQALLLSTAHEGNNAEALSEFQRDGPLRNLLWFYEEAYRRPGENRQDEGHPWGFKGLPNKEQITKDLGYFKSVVTSRQSWFDALDYLFYRNLSGDWYNSEYYSYLAP